jgi:uncharacterized protein (TIGR03067 family)
MKKGETAMRRILWAMLLLLVYLLGTGVAGSAVVNGGFEEGSFNGWGKSLDNIGFPQQEPDHNIKTGFGGVAPAEGTYFAWLWAHNGADYTYIFQAVYLKKGDVVSGMAAYGEPDGFKGNARAEIHGPNAYNPDDTTLIACAWQTEEPTGWSNFRWQATSAGTYTLVLSVQRTAGSDLLGGEDIYSVFAVFDEVRISAAPTCFGDFDRDGDVDGSDLAVFAADFGRTTCQSEILGIWIGDEVNDQPDSWGFVFSEDSLDIVGPLEWYRGTFLLNKAVEPNQIDFSISQASNPANEGKVTLGIFHIEDDTLSVAFYPPGDTSRPTSFIPDGTSRVFILSR